MKPETELRELDAWIAEHVMGWKPTFAVRKGDHYYRAGERGYTSSLYESGCYLKEEAEALLVRGEDMSLVPHERPNYTTNPADAMAVLEKCAEKVSLGIEISRDDSGEWFVENIGSDSTEAVMADTLPLAIAKFARQLFSA